MSYLLSPTGWGLLAGLTGLAGYIPYLRDSWRRTSDPDPAAWLIWTVEYSVLLSVQAAQHPPWAALSLAALQLAGTAAVLAVLAARGGWRFGAGRWALLGGAVAVMAGWPFAHAPGTAMCLVLAVEGTAMILVMIGAYRHPASETPLTWQAFILAGLFDLPALGSDAARLLYVYPAFFVVMGAGVLIAAALGARAVPMPAALVERARIQQALVERARAEQAQAKQAQAKHALAKHARAKQGRVGRVGRGQRGLQSDPEPAPPAPRPACPAGQWAICGASPHVLAPDGQGSRLLARGPGHWGRGRFGLGRGALGRGALGHGALGQGGRSPDETGDRLLGSQPS
jgi:hypothetical protein